MLIVLPKSEPNGGPHQVVADKTPLTPLDCDGGKRKSSLRRTDQQQQQQQGQRSMMPAVGDTTTPTSSRKSLKRHSRAVIIVEPDMIVSCDEYFSMLDAVRNHRMTDLKRRYESIGPLLIKLESLVLGTATGESFKMSLYYRDWEGATFASLLRLVKHNLNEFIRVLDDPLPLFQVDAQLQLDIVLCPGPNEIYEIIFDSVQDFLQRIRTLRRWQAGSCLEQQPLGEPGEARTSTNHFIDDIVSEESISKLFVKVQEKVRVLMRDAKEYLIR